MIDLRKGGLARAAMIYVLANVLNASIPFLLLPFLTTHLTQYDMGIIANFQALVGLVLPFIGVNMESAVARNYYEDDVDLPVFVWNGVLLLIGSTLAAIFFFLIFNGVIESVSKVPVFLLWMVVAFAAGEKLMELVLTLFRVSEKPVQFGIMRILRTCMDIGLSLYLILHVHRNWEGRVDGMVWAAIVFGVVSIVALFIKNWVRIKRNTLYIRKMLAFGSPLIIHSLGGAVMLFSDRFFLTTMIGVDASGVYSVGYQVGLIIGLLQNSFNQAWQPWFFKTLKTEEPGVKRRIVKITYAYFIFLILAALALSLLSPFIFSFLGKAFGAAMDLVLWVAIGYAVNGMYKMAVNYLFYVQKTASIATATIIAALVNIVLNYFFIRAFGMVGAAQAMLVAFFVQFVIIWVQAAKLYPMPWAIWKKDEQ